MTEYRSAMGDGTQVACWHDGEFWRARVDHAGHDFVRVDTAEVVRDRIPTRHVHRRASVTSDVVVFNKCEKSAALLGMFEKMMAEETGCPA